MAFRRAKRPFSSKIFYFMQEKRGTWDTLKSKNDDN
jgi:hypothetical protein